MEYAEVRMTEQEKDLFAWANRYESLVSSAWTTCFDTLDAKEAETLAWGYVTKNIEAVVRDAVERISKFTLPSVGYDLGTLLQVCCDRSTVAAHKLVASDGAIEEGLPLLRTALMYCGKRHKWPYDGFAIGWVDVNRSESLVRKIKVRIPTYLFRILMRNRIKALNLADFGNNACEYNYYSDGIKFVCCVESVVTKTIWKWFLLLPLLDLGLAIETHQQSTRGANRGQKSRRLDCRKKRG